SGYEGRRYRGIDLGRHLREPNRNCRESRALLGGARCVKFDANFRHRQLRARVFAHHRPPAADCAVPFRPSARRDGHRFVTVERSRLVTGRPRAPKMTTPGRVAEVRIEVGFTRRTEATRAHTVWQCQLSNTHDFSRARSWATEFSSSTAPTGPTAKASDWQTLPCISCATA